MVVIVDYGMGNVGSVKNMLRRIGAEATISSNPRDIEQAERLILPGVGAFDAGMRNLREMGLEAPLSQKVLERKTPVLGICLGMQLLTESSEEGVLSGLGWIKGRTARFAFNNRPDLKIPHMGWNTVTAAAGGALWRQLDPEAHFYFVHSFHVLCSDRQDVHSWTNYGYDFASSVKHRNIMGTQFHPEKSHRYGMTVLKNFCEAASDA